MVTTQLRQMENGYGSQGSFNRYLDVPGQPPKACIHFKTADDLALDVIGQIVATIPADRWVQIAQAARPR